jgi:monovalent cation:H+ antiporter-2, CPA2 family
VARGEFSNVIAGLGVSAELEPSLGAFSTAYVLFLAILGPLLALGIDPLMNVFKNRTIRRNP